ncbi:MAG: nucleotide exchange factor GrpE [Bdellovibrio sp.]
MSENQKPDNPNSESNGAPESATSSVNDALAQAEKFKNDYLYLRAEFDNYKRHAIKERADLLKYGAERVLIDVLGVLDNFERALETKATPENLPQYVKGVELTANELRTALTKFGVTEVPALGQNFDPALHEALSSEETAHYQPGQVSRVFKKPYRLHDKLIRPGQVVVAKKPTEN